MAGRLDIRNAQPPSPAARAGGTAGTGLSRSSAVGASAMAMGRALGGAPLTHLAADSAMAMGRALGGAPLAHLARRALATDAAAAVRRIRNVGIIAHIDAGKTTTTEHMLLCAGVTRRAGDVDTGTTLTDFLEEERERGITIQSAAITLPWAEHSINLIDTPGHVDFSVEVERSVRVLDGAVLVLDGVAGVQVQTEAVWRQAEAQGLPAVAFVNKMDRDGADFQRAIDSLHERLGVRAAALQLVPAAAEGGGGGGGAFADVIDLVHMRALHWEEAPGGANRRDLRALRSSALEPGTEAHARARAARAALIERVSEADDILAEAFLDSEDPAELPAAQVLAAVRRATCAGALVPVLAGAAARGVGVEPLLDAVAQLLPSPADRPPMRLQAPGAAADGGGGGGAPAADLAPTGVALAFKVVHDSQRRAVVFARVYSGVLKAKEAVLNTAHDGHAERAAGIMRIAGDAYESLDELREGEIGALSGLKHTATGDTLLAGCAKGFPPAPRAADAADGAADGGGGRGRGRARPRRSGALPALPGVHVPEPVFFCAIEPDSASEQAALDAALRALTLEDPSLAVLDDRADAQTLLCGMGELHLEVAAHRLQREFGLKPRVGRLRVAYRETCREALAHSATVRQALGAGSEPHDVRVELRVEPESADEAHAYAAHAAPGGAGAEHFTLGAELARALKRAEREAALAGLDDGTAAGPLCGLPLLGVRVRLDGLRPEPHTPPLAVRFAVASAVGEALQRAAPALLEPVSTVEVRAPEHHVGAVLSELTAQRRAHVLGVDVISERQHRVRAHVPLAALGGYVETLRALTHGEGALSMRFSHYGRLDAASEREVLVETRGYA